MEESERTPLFELFYLATDFQFVCQRSPSDSTLCKLHTQLISSGGPEQLFRYTHHSSSTLSLRVSSLCIRQVAPAVQQHTTSKRAAAVDDFCALQKVFNFSPFVSIIVCCLHALHTNQPHKLHMERGAFLVFPSRTRSVFIVLQRKSLFGSAHTKHSGASAKAKAE
jgi:hypothetical protein